MYRRSYYGYRTVRKERKTVDVIQYAADQVWAAACAAQRINGEYLKERQTDYNERYEPVRTREANKVMVREILSGKLDVITDADREQAAIVRQYWQGKLMDVLSDRANPFVKSAVEMSGRDEIASNDFLALGTIASLPSSYLRGVQRDEARYAKQEAQMGSQHFGRVGDKVTGQLEVLESRYSEKWDTWYVTAITAGNVILFAYRNELAPGAKYDFNGTVKAHRDDNVTQLNRVRLG